MGCAQGCTGCTQNTSTRGFRVHADEPPADSGRQGHGVHAQPSDQGKQGARLGARGAWSMGCTERPLSIEGVPYSTNLSEYEREVECILRWAVLHAKGSAGSAFSLGVLGQCHLADFGRKSARGGR